MLHFRCSRCKARIVSLVASFLVQIALDFEIPSADTVRFVPMQLNSMQAAVQKAYCCNSLAFAPPTAAMNLAKERLKFDARTCCNSFNPLDLADDLEFHSLILSREPIHGQGQLTPCRSAAAGAPHGARCFTATLRAPVGGCTGGLASVSPLSSNPELRGDEGFDLRSTSEL